MGIYYHCSSICFPQDGSVLYKMILVLKDPQLGGCKEHFPLPSQGKGHTEELGFILDVDTL